MKITKPNYSIEFDALGRIVSLTSGKKQFVSEPQPLFRLRLRNAGDTEVLTSDEADKVNTAEAENKVAFTYNFDKADLTVTAEIVFSDRIEYYLSFSNRAGRYVEWFDYPQIAVPNDLKRTGKGSGNILIDFNEGVVVEDLMMREKFFPYKDLEYPSEGLYGMFPAVIESQFLAYYDDEAGLYFAAEDEKRSIKGVDFRPHGYDSIALQFRLFPGAYPEEVNYKFSFPMVMDFFKGDWHSAAELYRNWFENNLPEGLKKVELNDNLPEWYKDSPLVVTYPVQGIHDLDETVPNRLFPYNNALPYLDDIAEKTGSRVMSVLMHWEGTAPWAPPYVWPPLGGVEMLKNFGDELHKRNFMLGVYCSGTGYTIKSNLNDYNNREAIERDNLEQYMCAPADGGKPVSKICQGQRSSYDMCISQDFTKNVLLKEAENMTTCGLDYVQILDQNHGGTPYFCMSDKHGHPAVPGGWMVEHMTDFLRDLKKTVGDKVLVGCESAAAEAYVPYLNLSDNRFNLNYRCGRPVPLYGYIYHEYLHNFSGNSVCSLDIIDIKLSPDCHMLRVAHSYLAGDLMTLVINQDGEIVWSWGERDFSILPEREPIMQFVKSATAYRRGVGKNYLVFGKMIKPVDVESDLVSMYNVDCDGYHTDYPAVLTTAWQASNGTTAQFLASYRKKEETCIVDLIGTNGAELIDEQGNVIATLGAEKVTVKVPAHSVRMLRFL